MVHQQLRPQWSRGRDAKCHDVFPSHSFPRDFSSHNLSIKSFFIHIHHAPLNHTQEPINYFQRLVKHGQLRLPLRFRLHWQTRARRRSPSPPPRWIREYHRRDEPRPTPRRELRLRIEELERELEMERNSHAQTVQNLEAISLKRP